MSIKIVITVVVGMLWFTGICFSDDQIDMDSLFSNDDFFVQTDDLEDDFINSKSLEPTINFSGYFLVDAKYSINWDENASTIYHAVKTIYHPVKWLRLYSDIDDSILDAYHLGEHTWYEPEISANLVTDIQLHQNIRGIINLDANFAPSGISDTQTTRYDSRTYSLVATEADAYDMSLNEAFFDTNLGGRIFVRAGKQVLQWGRGYLFNPTDLISGERKNLLDMDANREGTYGIKAHVPFGVKYNIYSFFDFGTDENLDYFACAGKFEFLLDKTELSVSAWKENGGYPVFGFDFSTRFKELDIIGELSLSSKETIRKPENNFSISKTEKTWIPRASLGVMKSFDFNGINDRINLVLELYYDQAGYSENIFDNPVKVVALLANDLYDIYSYSKYYGMFFLEYRDFISSDLTLQLTGLENFNDHSGVVMAQLKYNFLDNYTLEFSVSSTTGGANSQFTLTGNITSAEFSAKIYF